MTRSMLLAACSGLGFLAACSGGGGAGGSGGDDGGGPTIVTLFSDDFSSGDLTDNWVVSGVGADTGTITSDSSVGNPAPSAWFSEPAGASSTGVPKLTSQASFSVDGGLTFSFHAATRAQGEVLVTFGGGSCRGNVQIQSTKVNYQILSGGGDTTATQLINQDTDFHTFVFQITPAGATALWRDGQFQLSRAPSSTCTGANVQAFRIEARVYLPDNTVGVSLNLDNVHLTRP